MERIILEIAGPAIIGGASFGISNFFNISNIDKKFSKDINTVYFCAIPVLVYVIFRLYFLALFHLLSVGKFSESRPRISRAVVFSGLIAAVYSVTKLVPKVNESFQQLYDQNVGDLPLLVLRAGEGQIQQAKQMGGRIAGLVLGWFLFLFFFELLLRLILTIIALILALFRGKVAEPVDDENDDKLAAEKTYSSHDTKKDL